MTCRIILLCLTTTVGLSPVATGQAVLIPATSNRMTPTVHAVSQVLPSVVNISTDRQVIVQYKYQIGAVTYRSRPQADHRESLGSGIVIDQQRGLVLTNDHVVKQAHRIIVTLADGTNHAATPIATSSASDLALLMLDDFLPRAGVKDIRFAIPGDVLLGEVVIAAGNPFGLGHSVAEGIVSAVGRNKELNGVYYHDIVQTTISINPGNSGGPMSNADGDLIGMSTFTEEEAEGISFAIPVQQLENVLSVWLIPSRFGMNSCGFVPGTRVVDGKGVAVVRKVFEGTPAAAAGLQPGQVIDRFNGVPVRQAIDISRRLWELKEADEVEVALGSGEVINFTVAGMPDVSELSGKELGVKRLGLELQQMTERLAKVWGFLDYRGLVVSEVMPDSVLRRRDLKRGDIIRFIGEEPITDFVSLARAFQRVHYGDVVTLVVDRPGQSGPYGSGQRSFQRRLIEVPFFR